jgi:hypothetical protein
MSKAKIIVNKTIVNKTIVNKERKKYINITDTYGNIKFTTSYYIEIK